MLINALNNYVQDAFLSPNQTNEQRESSITGCDWLKRAAAVLAIAAPAFAYFYPMIFSFLAIAAFLPVLGDACIILNNASAEQNSHLQGTAVQAGEAGQRTIERLLDGTIFTGALIRALDRVHVVNAPMAVMAGPAQAEAVAVGTP